jgi:hypothetical protein
VIFVDHLCFLRFSKIKSIAISILVSNYEIHWLLWVPAKCRWFIFEVDFIYWGVASDVIETNAPVESSACKEVYLTWVELHSGHGVDSPLEGLKGLRSFVVPDLHDGSTCGEHVFGVAVIQAKNHVLRDVSGSRSIVPRGVSPLQSTILSIEECLMLGFQLVKWPQMHLFIITSWNENGVCRQGTIICESQSSTKEMMRIDLE